VAITFFLLAPYIAQDAIRALINGQHPATSWLGIALSISSIIVMPVLGRAKLRVGRALGSGATSGEGNQNLLCAYLAAGVLSGLVLNLAFGVWWADPAIALGIAGMAINEGRNAWAGEDCCAATPIPCADAGAPLNAFGHGRELFDAAHGRRLGLVGINTDRLYSRAQVDVGPEPVVLSVPDAAGAST
jgi:Cation efflux family/Protein of unknown function (DUF1254)